jgi:uncharacterized membrane protein YfcA
LLVALIAGALLGLTLGTVGGGGAVLAVPVLVYLLGQSVHAATAESLVIVVGASSAGAISHARHGVACWKLAAAFTIAAVPGSLAGTFANRVVAAEPLLVAFAVLLLGVSALTWRRGNGAPVETSSPCPNTDLAVVAAAGLSTGLLTGLFGVGGGFAIVPALAIGLRVPLRRAIATSLVIISLVSTIGLGEHLATGTPLAWGIAFPFAAAALLTASFGGTIAYRLPQRTLARTFALLLAGIAGYVLVSITALGGPPNG